MKYGYARVSTKDQKLDLQINALKAAGCEIIYSEKTSGAQDERPQLNLLLEQLKAGDALVVWKLDRLARSTKQLLALSEQFSEKGIDLISLKDAIDTSTPQGKFWFTMVAAMSELERDLIVERTNAGLAAARAKGIELGRPRTCGKQVETAKMLHDQGYTVKDACERTGISRQTYYRWLREEQGL